MKLSPFAALAAVSTLGLSIVACTAASPEAATTGDDQEVVTARLQCSVDGDKCQHGGAGDLEYCIEGVTMRQASNGKVRLEVKRRSTVNDPAGDKAITLLSDAPASLTGPKVKAAWDGGEFWTNLTKAGAEYKGSLTLEQDFSVNVKCKQTGASSCLYQGKTYAVGESFPDTDGCNTCSCSAGGIACTEIACAPPAGCRVGNKQYRVGQSWKDADGCNTCSCSQGGYAACTELACAPQPATCQVGNRTYRVGQSFPAPDGCNTCTCQNGGYAACTELACR